VRDVDASRPWSTWLPETAKWIDIGYHRCRISKWSRTTPAPCHARHANDGGPTPLQTPFKLATTPTPHARSVCCKSGCGTGMQNSGQKPAAARRRGRGQSGINMYGAESGAKGAGLGAREQAGTRVPMTVTPPSARVWRAIKDEDWCFRRRTIARVGARKLGTSIALQHHAGRELVPERRSPFAPLCP